MCLAKIHDKKSNRKTGYKLLHAGVYGGFETGQCGGSKVTLSTTRYTTDSNTLSIVSYGRDTKTGTYPAGFHIFLSQRSAERVRGLEKDNLVLCKVRFKGEVAYGKVSWGFAGKSRFRSSTVVARKCKIIEVIR